MFDFAWSEIALIGVLALVLIGPKDLPIAMKVVSQTLKKARRMAGEFQTHVDEMVRDADLNEVRNTFNDLRQMNIKDRLLKAVDDDGGLRKTLSEPLTDFAPPPPPVPVHDADPLTAVPFDTPAASVATEEAAPVEAPAFIPPGFAPPRGRPAAPAFIPPAAAAAQHAASPFA